MTYFVHFFLTIPGILRNSHPQILLNQPNQSSPKPTFLPFCSLYLFWSWVAGLTCVRCTNLWLGEGGGGVVVGGGEGELLESLGKRRGLCRYCTLPPTLSHSQGKLNLNFDLRRWRQSDYPAIRWVSGGGRKSTAWAKSLCQLGSIDRWPFQVHSSKVVYKRGSFSSSGDKRGRAPCSLQPFRWGERRWQLCGSSSPKNPAVITSSQQLLKCLHPSQTNATSRLLLASSSKSWRSCNVESPAKQRSKMAPAHRQPRRPLCPPVLAAPWARGTACFEKWLGDMTEYCLACS